MILTDFQSRFKNIGKLIFISQLPAAQITALQKAHMALVDQASSGEATDFDTNDLVVSPFGGSMKSVVTAVKGLPAKCKSAIDTYLKKVIAVDLGLPTTSTLAQIGTALDTQMTAVGAHVTPSGNGGSNSTGIAMYFADNFDIELNQDPSPSIPDAYITDTVL